MNRADVVQAKRLWVEARNRVSELEDAVASAEQRLEDAHYGWEQWQGKSDVLTAMADLDAARDAEREARREFERVRCEYEERAGSKTTR